MPRQAPIGKPGNARSEWEAKERAQQQEDTLLCRKDAEEVSSPRAEVDHGLKGSLIRIEIERQPLIEAEDNAERDDEKKEPAKAL